MAISWRQRCLRDIAIDYNVYSLPGIIVHERLAILLFTIMWVSFVRVDVLRDVTMVWTEQSAHLPNYM